MSQTEFSIIDAEVGLLGGTALVIGNVVAMTVFLLPAHLIADGAGPSIALAMVVVSLVVGFGIIGRLQVGGAMPAAGGSYVYATRLIHPYFGFLLPWIAVPALWAGQVYLAYGFAEFVRFFGPFSDLPVVALMYGVLLPFLALNVLGIRLVTAVQLVLVGIILLGMVLFVVPGVMHVDTANYTPTFPNGLSPFFVAMVSLAIAMNGFSLATDLGEELKDPVRNIPRVLGLSAVISITLMTAVVVVAVGVVPPEYYVTDAGTPIEAGVAVAAAEFLPPWGASLVALAAVVGAFTTINTLYTSSSRSIMRAARDELLPASLSKIHPRFDTPHRALLLVGLPPLFLVRFTFSPVWLTVAMAMAGLIGSVFSAVALWNLPRRFPERYENAIYRLPKPALEAVAVISGLTSLLLLLAVSTSLWWLALLVGGYMAAGYPVYRVRVRSLRKRGVDLPERMKHLHDHEVERARAGQRGGDGERVEEPSQDSTPTGTD